MPNSINGHKLTKELEDTLQYMSDTLALEFPTSSFSVEYLVVALLDNKKCHANVMLDHLLMSDKMDALRDAFSGVLESTHDGNPQNLQQPDYSNIMPIMGQAAKEAEELGNEMLGTEHVILSILRMQGEESEPRNVFEKVGITYKKLRRKFMVPKPKVPQQPIPPKSGVNVVATAPNMEFIQKYTINLTKMAREGKLDRTVGRENELRMIEKILARRRKNNVVLVGDGGVGKTAIVRALAARMADGSVPAMLRNKEIVLLNAMALVSGTQFRGMFEDRVNGLFREIKESNKYILFIDDMHTVIKIGSKEKDTDMSGLLDEALEDGRIRIIGALNFRNYKNGIESNPTLCHKIHKMVIDRPSTEEAIHILSETKEYYEKFHHVVYTDDAIECAVRLADRYVPERALPDSAFDIIDMAGARSHIGDEEPDSIRQMRAELASITNDKVTAMNSGNFEEVETLNDKECLLKKQVADYVRNSERAKDDCPLITEYEIADTVSEMTQIPASNLSGDDAERLIRMSASIKQNVIGQDEAIDAICKVIKRNRVGLGNRNRPMGSFLFVGESGVGKTMVAKELAKQMFGDEKAMVRIDMSEYSEKSSVAKLTGASPGYIGFENGGMLTEAVKNHRYCVLLLDEIEKAHNEVHNLFLQLLDDGRLTDGGGQTVSFKNVIILMTSNVGVKEASEIGDGIGFVTNGVDKRKRTMEKALKKKFPPEFINRIDKIVYFNSLTDENLKTITSLEIRKLGNRLDEIGYGLYSDSSVTEYISSQAFSQRNFGARPINRLVQDSLEDTVTELILGGHYKKPYVFSATCNENKITVS